MTHFFPLTIGVLFAGTLLSSCSTPQAPASSAGTSAGEAPVARGTVSRPDSLDGIPGHHFGEPLSAFPGLQLTQTQHPGCQTYSYPEGKPEPGWFGKYKKEVGFTFYVFEDGKFVAFGAIAFGAGRAALQQEATYLFGGQPNGLDTTWHGQKATAYTTSQELPLGPALELDVASAQHLRTKARVTAAQLKADNAQ